MYSPLHKPRWGEWDLHTDGVGEPHLTNLDCNLGYDDGSLGANFAGHGETTVISMSRQGHVDEDKMVVGVLMVKIPSLVLYP